MICTLDEQMPKHAKGKARSMYAKKCTQNKRMTQMSNIENFPTPRFQVRRTWLYDRPSANEVEHVLQTGSNEQSSCPGQELGAVYAP